MNNYLIKNSDFQYDKDDVFKNDSLDRKVIIENLSNLIWSATQSFVISIESPWGTGKTVFVKLWKQYLEKENTPCIYFNAWENDFISDPIIPFISTLDEYVKDEIKNIDDSKIKISLEKAKHLGAYIAKKSIPVILKIGTQGLLNLDTEEVKKILNDEQLKEIPGLMSDFAEDAVNEFSKKKNSINELKKKIKEIADELIIENKKKPPLVIFIDELDRCRPDFAILVLERLKHLFSVEGAVFVLSVDRRQLENSVKAIYGTEIDACGYLLRFIDYRFRLPEPNSYINYFKAMMDKFGLYELIKNINSFRLICKVDLIREYFSIFTVIYELSLREQEKFFTELNLFLRILPVNHELFEDVIIFFLMTRLKHEAFFGKIISNNIDIKEFEEFFNKSIQMLKLEDEKYKLGHLQGMLLKFISYKSESKFINSIPPEYQSEINDDPYLRGKFYGFKVDELRTPFRPFINNYIKQLRLLDRIQ
jgi:DNA polymerase III delta prime subunit